jgi:hypothetical protein
MTKANDSQVGWLVESCAGWQRTERLMRAVFVDARLLQARRAEVSRAELAQALNLLLLNDLLRRVPTGALYVLDKQRRGERLVFDHGAIRTVRAACGELPIGQDAVARILGPLGYEVAGLYPLDELKMTGRAYCHRDFPETIAQFFVSELHPERFTPGFQETVARVLAPSRDPLSPRTLASLAVLAEQGSLDAEEARRILPELLSAFDRQHPVPSLEDYETLRAESREMAWIATEGNAFNHATDRVVDVAATADEQRRRGRPVKPDVEVSQSGRVRQTAFYAAMVERLFVAADGSLRAEVVPGSFHEFITRAEEAPGVLDLRFDSGNATAIFRMTSKA